jgi:AcrR family transcriptional regulator
VSATPLFSASAEPGRRQVTPKQAALLDRLVEAAAGEARDLGYEGTTVRSAARRAGVAAATAYTYFASKDHLLAEVMWRHMAALLAAPIATDTSATDRVVRELRLLGTFMSDDPELAAAGTTALLGPGPDVRAIRIRIGTATHDRLAHALGDPATGESGDPAIVQALDLMYSGALLWMGMGHLPPERVPDALAEAAVLIMADPAKEGSRP